MAVITSVEADITDAGITDAQAMHIAGPDMGAQDSAPTTEASRIVQKIVSAVVPRTVSLATVSAAATASTVAAGSVTAAEDSTAAATVAGTADRDPSPISDFGAPVNTSFAGVLFFCSSYLETLSPALIAEIFSVSLVVLMDAATVAATRRRDHRQYSPWKGTRSRRGKRFKDSARIRHRSSPPEFGGKEPRTCGIGQLSCDDRWLQRLPRYWPRPSIRPRTQSILWPESEDRQSSNLSGWRS
jgi:hypothetical protein